LAATAVGQPETVYYVSLRGKDTNPGTEAAPFRTPARAQQAVREEIARGLQRPLRVVIRPGTYFLPQPLLLGPEDSGTERYPVVWAAAGTVVLSGGRRVTGWARQQGNLWAAWVPWAKEKPFRQLYVKGRRATRARTPNADAAPPYWQVTLSESSPDLKTFRLGFGPGKPPSLSRPSDVEMVTLGNWAICRKRVDNLDPATGTLTLAPPHVAQKDAPWNWPSVGRWGFLEGAREFLDQPGEWYLDREAGVVYYLAQPGEDLTRAETIVPVLTRILEIRGTPEQPVRAVYFFGIRFRHAAGNLPEGGYYGVQACHYVTGGTQPRWEEVQAALHWQWARDCVLDRGEVAYTGGSGLYLAEGCRGCLVRCADFHDIGGNGIMVGGPNDPARVTEGNLLADNRVYQCGVEFYGAVGLWVGLAARTAVIHNEIHDLPYSGISVGWQWNPEPTVCQVNLIEYNHVYAVMQQLADGGGIYTLGFQPGTVLRGNLVHDIGRSRYAQGAPNNGFFIDEGSKGFLIEANTIYNTADQPVRHNQNQPDWHTWKDNSFGAKPEPGTPAAEAIARVMVPPPGVV
jgi:hypothetical protein